MRLDIATATRCSCGSAVHITDGPGCAGKIFLALCRHCLDGTEDAGERAHVQGFGDSIDEALWAWQDAHDEAHEVEWVLADLFGELSQQVSIEADRQRGWSLACAGTGNPPRMRPVGGELVCGPPASLLAATAECGALL